MKNITVDNIMNLNYNKYLKYKLKYINLKKKLGGGSEDVPEDFKEASKHWIRAKPKHSYDFDYESAFRYADSFCLNDQQKFYRKIFENTIHVTFEEFLLNLKICIDKFKSDIGSEPFILYTNMEEKSVNWNKIKSNSWISLISYPLLKDLDIYIANSREEIINLIDSKKIKNILLMDDASYSGNQFKDSTNFLVSVIWNKDEKPRKKLVLDSDPIWFQDFKINIVIPYISNIALKKISNIIHEDIKIYNNVIMKTCNDLDFSEFESESNYQKLFKRFGLLYNATTLSYFDHKIADFMSVPGLLWFSRIESKYNSSSEDRELLGPNRNITHPEDLKHCDNPEIKHTRYNIPLIKNCKEMTSAYSANCPPGFYKEQYKESREILPEGVSIWDNIL